MSLKKSISKRFLILKRNIGKKKKPKSPDSKKIMIAQFAGLGDAALLAPYVNWIRNHGFDTDIYTWPGMEQFWNYFFDDLNVYTFDRGLGFGDEIERLGNEISGRNYESAFSTSINSISAYLAGSAGTDEIYGMAEEGAQYTGMKSLLNKFYEAGADEHINSRYENLFGFKFENIKPEKRKIEKEQKYIAVVHPGAKWIPRRWPLENFIALANKLGNRGIPALFLFGKHEKDWYYKFMNETFAENIFVKNPAGMIEMIDLMLSGKVFLGNDSGPAHIANFAGLKTIVLWGPGNYERIRPAGENVQILMKEIDCRPCRQYINETRCERGENLCLQRITVDEVLDAVLKNAK